jgi:hypothetical protein
MGITLIASNDANRYIFKKYIPYKNLFITGNETKLAK